jgi:GxxExxY protein
LPGLQESFRLDIKYIHIINYFISGVCMLEDPVSEQVIGCAFRVANTLGPGFLEKVYENALLHELRKAGLRVQAQKSLVVWYDGVVVGEFMVDLLVEERILVELKACRALNEAHVAQGLNYLAATGLKTCLLLNFGGPKVEVRRLGRDRC